MLFAPVPCYFLPLRPKYVPEHPILEHPQPMLLSECDRPSFTHTHTHTNTHKQQSKKITALPLLAHIFLENKQDEKTQSVYTQYTLYATQY